MAARRSDAPRSLVTRLWGSAPHPVSGAPALSSQTALGLRAPVPRQGKPCTRSCRDYPDSLYTAKRYSRLKRNGSAVFICFFDYLRFNRGSYWVQRHAGAIQPRRLAPLGRVKRGSAGHRAWGRAPHARERRTRGVGQSPILLVLYRFKSADLDRTVCRIVSGDKPYDC